MNQSERELKQYLPHAHFFMLWLAPNLLWLQLYQTFPPGGVQDSVYLGGGSMLVLYASATLLLRMLEPPLSSHRATLQSDAYSWIAKLSNILSLLFGGSLIFGWFQGSWTLIIGALVGISIASTMPLLAHRVVVTDRGIWSLGRDVSLVPFAKIRAYVWASGTHIAFDIGQEWPMQVRLPSESFAETLQEQLDREGLPKNGVHRKIAEPPKHVMNPIVGVPAWRNILWAAMSLFGLVAWAWFSWGPSVWIIRPFSFASFAILFLGFCICGWFCHWPPNWLGWRWGQAERKYASRATFFFYFFSVPVACLLIVQNGWSIVQSCLAGPDGFSVGKVWVDALMLALGCFILADPSGSVAWIRQKDGRRYIRRSGWVEEYPLEGSFT